MSAFQYGDALRIHRPNKKDHDARARFVEISQDPTMAWVAFHKESRARLPYQHDLRHPGKVTRKLYPLTQLRAEATS